MAVIRDEFRSCSPPLVAKAGHNLGSCIPLGRSSCTGKLGRPCTEVLRVVFAVEVVPDETLESGLGVVAVDYGDSVDNDQQVVSMVAPA